MTAQDVSRICTNMTVKYGRIMDIDTMMYVYETINEQELTQANELSEVAKTNLKQKDLEQGRVVELRYRCTKVSI